MKRIYVIVMSVISAGELTIACEFVSRLSKDEYEIKFLISQNHSKYLKSKKIDFLALDSEAGKDENRKTILDSIEEFKPDYFIVSDVYTLEHASSLSGVKFKDLKSLGIPIIGVDEYEFPSTEYRIDYYADSFKRLPAFIEECDYLIRDCPINKCDKPKGKIWSFSLFDRKYTLSEEKKLEIRKKLNISEDSKIVFFTTSSWEAMNIRNVSSLKYLIKWIPIMLKEYLKALKKDITVIHVGCNEWEDTENTNINYKYYKYINPKDFEQYLFASDLYVTLNMASVTLSKAIYAGIPSLVFKNDKVIDYKKLENKVKQMPKWYREMANEVKMVYPFKASTFGWSKFLQAVLQNNEYRDTFVEVPFFKLSESIEFLDKYIFDNESINELKKNQSQYIDKVLKLPNPNEIMDEIDKLNKNKIN